MDASLAAFVLGAVNLALLGLLGAAWFRDRGEPSWRLKMALRLQELDQRLNELSGLLKKQDDLRKVVRGELMACVDAQAGEVETLKGRFDVFAGGMSLEAGSLRNEVDALRGEMDAHARSAGAEAKLVGCTLADRIDAVSVRLDALEQSRGPKEEGETMNGTQSRNGWKTALQNWKSLLGTLKGLLLPLWRVLQRGK